jgi:hypothetical protein
MSRSRSSPRKRGPSFLAKSWMPACAGMSGKDAQALPDLRLIRAAALEIGFN